MKLFILTLFTILFFSTPINSQNSRWFLLFDDDQFLNEVTAYFNRVNSNGGKIVDKNVFNKQIKLIKSHNYSDSLLFWVTSNGGIKTNTDTVAILFDFKGNDLTPYNLFPGPLLSQVNTTNSAAVVFDGINSLHNPNFLSNHPFSLILAITIDSTKYDRCILSSYLNKDYSISVDKKNELTVESKTKLKNGYVNYQRVVIVVYFNGSASCIYVNNVLVKSGNLNSVQLVGLLFGMNQKHNPDFFSGYLFTCGIFKSILPDKFRSELTALLNK